MEVQHKDNIGFISENLSKQSQLSGKEMSNLEVPKIGEDNLNRVTQSSEPFVFNKSASEQQTQHPYQHCPKPGEPMPSVDNTEEAGVDCTREPDWKVIESENLPEHPYPDQIHNDKYWDERSLDREISEQNYQDKLLYDEQYNSDRAKEEIDEHGRPFQNDVLDPYYQNTIDSSHHNG